MSTASTLLGDEDDVIVRRPKRGSRRTARALVPSETQVQIAIINRLKFYGVSAFHVPNEGKRTRSQHVAQKRQGMVKGAPDLVVFRAGAVAFLEVKRPGYTASDVRAGQRDFRALSDRQRVPYYVVTSQDEAVAALRGEGWAL